VIACDAAMPRRLLATVAARHAAKAQAFRKLVDTLAVRLHDILRAAYIHSQAGVSAARACAAPWARRGGRDSTST
jgi:hypothetical protein